MHPAWRLATSTLAARPSRTALLVGAVALSAALICAVACAMATAQNAVRTQMQGQFGYADIRVDAVSPAIRFDRPLAGRLAQQPGVGAALPWVEEGYSVDLATRVMAPGPDGLFVPAPVTLRSRALARGHPLDQFPLLVSIGAIELLHGRAPRDAGEVIIDAVLAERLTKRFESKGIVGFSATDVSGDLSYLALSPELPASSDQAGADIANAAVGPRVGDVLELVGVRRAPAATTGPADRVEHSALGAAIAGAADQLADAHRRFRLALDAARDGRLTPWASSLASAPGMLPLALARPWATLGLRVDDALAARVDRPDPVRLTIVGIASAPPLGGRARLFIPLETLESLEAPPAQLTRIELLVDEGATPDDVSAGLRDRFQPEFGPELVVQTTTRITAGVDRNMQSSRLALVLTAFMAFMAAAFIIATAMNTALAEQQRALATIRCVGGTRAQLAHTQLLAGALVGLGGALVGLPLGIGVAFGLAESFRERLGTGLVIPLELVLPAGLAAIVSGVAGAAWPAWRASRTSPLQALQTQSRPVTPAAILATAAIGLFGIAAQLLIAGLPTDGQTIFWGYATVGLPLMFTGYFLVCVPLLVLLARALGPVVGRAFALPPRLLTSTLAATPYRYGLTAGAMMSGLGLMIAIWINGGAFLRDWLGKIQFPDAFVNGTNLTESTRATLDALPFVDRTAPLSLMTVKPIDVGFGVRALQSYNTLFVGFEPDSFFDMTDLVFTAGNVDDARRALDRGPHDLTRPDGSTVRVEGAILVGREFQTAFGLSPGDVFACARVRPGGDYTDAPVHRFVIAGVVVNPGLELVSQFFNIGQQFVEQSLHAVAGRRDDLQRVFGHDRIALIQLDLNASTTDAEALRAIQTALPDAGIIEVGSGRAIKDQIEGFVASMLLVFSAVAGVAMFTAGFGVANLIAAAIEARKREFGVLRSVGGSRSLLVRLVLAEATMITITAVAAGTLIGVQGAWAGQRMHAKLLGLDLELVLTGKDVLPGILLGWLMVAVFTIAASVPSIARLNARRPRELLGG